MSFIAFIECTLKIIRELNVFYVVFRKLLFPHLSQNTENSQIQLKDYMKYSNIKLHFLQSTEVLRQLCCVILFRNRSRSFTYVPSRILHMLLFPSKYENFSDETEHFLTFSSRKLKFSSNDTEFQFHFQSQQYSGTLLHVTFTFLDDIF